MKRYDEGPPGYTYLEEEPAPLHLPGNGNGGFVVGLLPRPAGIEAVKSGVAGRQPHFPAAGPSREAARRPFFARRRSGRRLRKTAPLGILPRARTTPRRAEVLSGRFIRRRNPSEGHGRVHLHHEGPPQGGPPKREILRGIWLSFYYGAKIGVLGLNGAGKARC